MKLLPDFRLLTGDVRDILPILPEKSIQCCVTSPPYWGLRDYGVTNQIGLEKTPAEYVAHLVKVFQQVRRVLRDDGTLWLNLGDSYFSQGGSRVNCTDTLTGQGSRRKAELDTSRKVPQGMKPKDLVGIPWMVAFALRDDGWYLRADIIWHKPNPMPESIRDRPTKSHEYIFLLTKSKKYYYDGESVKEPSTGQQGNAANFQRATKRVLVPGQSVTDHRLDRKPTVDNGFRNRRSVWVVTPKPYKGAHFATFPPKLIEPCILAGSASGDLVLDPFSGAGTTGLVARQFGRRYIGIDLNPEYNVLARKRISGI